MGRRFELFRPVCPTVEWTFSVCLFLNGLFVDLCDLLLISLFGSEQQDDESSVEKLQRASAPLEDQCDSSGFTLYVTSCNRCVCMCVCLQARIAFLQGERKGQENLKNDLVRRIKMLEYALKQERQERIFSVFVC